MQCRPLRHRPSACGLRPSRRHIHNGKTFTHVLSLAYMNLANSNLQSETRQQVDVRNDAIITPSTPENAVGLLPRAWPLLCGAAIYSASAWGSAVARSTVRAMREPICAGRVTVVSALFVIVCSYRTQQTLKTRPTAWRHKGTRLITMEPLIYTAALAVGYTQRPTSTAYACKQQSAHTATHFACPAFAWAGTCCIAIGAAFPRCKSAWNSLERFVGLAPKAPFPHSATARVTYAHTLCSHFVWFAPTFCSRNKRRHIGSA